MTLIDPTSGLGYAFGQKLPSTHMTTIATQQPNAIDGAGGGAYAPAAPIILNGASALQLGGNLKYTARAVGRVATYAGNARTLSGNWALYTNDAWRNTAAGGTLWVTLDRIPHNATLDEVRMRWRGAVGHAALPTMPKIELFRVDTDSVRTSLGFVSDTTATIAAYEVAHNVVLPIAAVVNLASYRYVLEITGELGANFVSGAQPRGFSISSTITEQAEV